MAIIQIVTRSDFRDAFNKLRPDNFSYEGLGHLYDYLDQLSDETGQSMELDVIAICCDYSEDSVYDVCESYNLESVDELHDRTVIVRHDQLNATVLYQVF